MTNIYYLYQSNMKIYSWRYKYLHWHLKGGSNTLAFYATLMKQISRQPWMLCFKTQTRWWKRFPTLQNLQIWVCMQYACWIQTIRVLLTNCSHTFLMVYMYEKMLWIKPRQVKVQVIFSWQLLQVFQYTLLRATLLVNHSCCSCTLTN